MQARQHLQQVAALVKHLNAIVKVLDPMLIHGASLVMVEGRRPPGDANVRQRVVDRKGPSYYVSGAAL
jgi:hypothetical protein